MWMEFRATNSAIFMAGLLEDRRIFGRTIPAIASLGQFASHLAEGRYRGSVFAHAHHRGHFPALLRQRLAADALAERDVAFVCGHWKRFLGLAGLRCVPRSSR